MRFKVGVVLVGLVFLAACSAPQGDVNDLDNLEVQGSPGVVRQMVSAGTTSFRAGPLGAAKGIQDPEFSPLFSREEDEDLGLSSLGTARDRVVNRSPFKGQRSGPLPQLDNGLELQRRIAQPDPALTLSFEGLNLFQQRFANSGNQFTVEPPDQALCVGNGFVLESVNDVLRVFDNRGKAVTGVVDLNTFYNYPPAIVRGATPVFGPSLTDPVCYYDQDTRTWFHVVLTLDVNPTTGSLIGTNHLDIAVSKTADPTGSWTIYRFDVTNDGAPGSCPCIGDFPHIGADANGFYITTNSFPLFQDGFNGAFIYAFPKRLLAAGARLIQVPVFETEDPLGNPGFTVWPSKSPARDYENKGRGTEYFMSSLAVFNDSGTDDRIVVWSLSNTKSLTKRNPDPRLNSTVVDVNPYGVPPLVDQKSGPFPLGQCLNKDDCAKAFFGAVDPFKPEKLSKLDASDSRMQQVYYADGTLWGALGTALSVGGKEKAGAAWYALEPKVKRNGVSAAVVRQGYVGLLDTNLTYPAIAVNKKGQGVIAFTLVGPNNYPSAAYVGVNADYGTGKVLIAADGVGPQDGFSGYKFFNNPPRPRWGDYGAAAVDEKGDIWLASEYIAQSCTLKQWRADPTCGGTRAPLGNWSTRVSLVRP